MGSIQLSTFFFYSFSWIFKKGKNNKKPSVLRTFIADISQISWRIQKLLKIKKHFFGDLLFTAFEKMSLTWFLMICWWQWWRKMPLITWPKTKPCVCACIYRQLPFFTLLAMITLISLMVALRMIMNVMLEVMRMSINKVSAVLDHFFFFSWLWWWWQWTE